MLNKNYIQRRRSDSKRVDNVKDQKDDLILFLKTQIRYKCTKRAKKKPNKWQESSREEETTIDSKSSSTLLRKLNKEHN